VLVFPARLITTLVVPLALVPTDTLPDIWLNDPPVVPYAHGRAGVPGLL
jgi:hypothetical protein